MHLARSATASRDGRAAFSHRCPWVPNAPHESVALLLLGAGMHVTERCEQKCCARTCKRCGTGTNAFSCTLRAAGACKGPHVDGCVVSHGVDARLERAQAPPLLRFVRAQSCERLLGVPGQRWTWERAVGERLRSINARGTRHRRTGDMLGRSAGLTRSCVRAFGRGAAGR